MESRHLEVEFERKKPEMSAFWLLFVDRYFCVQKRRLEEQEENSQTLQVLFLSYFCLNQGKRVETRK